MPEWKHILRLLCFCILVDNRIYKEEVDCFVDEAIKLCDRLNPDMLFSKKMAFDWFMAHRDEQLAQLKSDKVKLHILDSIVALSKLEGREYLFAAMEKISQSDGEYHENEANLLAMAKQHWT